jgi:hypothetical protein
MTKDPTYPRILFIPSTQGWLVEVQYSVEASIAAGPFRSAHDGLFDALLRISKETEDNRRPGDEEPGC